MVRISHRGVEAIIVQATKKRGYGWYGVTPYGKKLSRVCGTLQGAIKRTRIRIDQMPRHHDEGVW